MRPGPVALAAAALAIVTTAAPPRALADERDAFYAAADLAQGGRAAEALEDFVALADRSPRDAFADDALLEAARLAEERLGDPRRALALYERLLREHPSSRLAVRAARRAEELRAGMGPDGRDAEALAAWHEILHGFASRPRAESIARAEALLRERPDFAAAPRVVYWLGTVHAQDGRDAPALARFREVTARWPDSEWAAQARKAEGDVLLRRGDYEGARRAYESLRGRGDPALDETAAHALATLARERRRARLATACWGVLALFAAGSLAAARRAAGSWRGLARALARPPSEAIYLVPIVALFVLAGTTEHEAILGALAFIGAGSLAIAWLSGGALAAVARLSLPRALAHGGAAAVAAAALVYLALFREGLLDLVVETIRFGAER